MRFSISVSGFRVQGSAPPLAAGAASLIEKETSGCGVSYERFKVYLKST